MLFATLSAHLTDFSILSTLEVALSASRQLRQTLEMALSSVPTHPYERVKSELLGPDFIPLTIDQLAVDENFCPNTCLANICAISTKINTNVMSHFYAVTSGNLSALDCNAFIELSATKHGEEFVISPKRASGYVGMLEMIRNIPIQLIETDPQETAKKLITHYINVMS